MSIHLKVSNSLEILAIQLSENLKELQINPFRKQIIATQTEGINSWLKFSITKHSGIAANINFCKVNDIISTAYRACGLSGKSILNQEIMKWSLFEILGDKGFNKIFPEISSYYEANPIKKIALANELADLFEQYQVYRFTTIEEWNKSDQKQAEKEGWQAYLWKLLKEKHSEKYEDKSEMGFKLLDALNQPENQNKLKSAMPEIHLFGMAILAPFHLKLLHEIAKSIDVYLYITNPAPEEYWLEDKSEYQIAKLIQQKSSANKDGQIQGNDLLLNWGTIIKNTFSLLFEDENIINTMDVAITNPNNKDNSLLQKIQEDILHNIPFQEENKYHIDDIKDGSITINGCYSALREVEVFYNYILELIDKKGVLLSPRDIVVMVSDINYYAPYIHAIFGNGPHYIPYTVADETIISGNNMFSALKSILNIDAKTFKAEAVLELLDSTYIKKRFKFLDVDAVRNAVKQAGIYYGSDNRLEDDTYLVSWNYGLKKILYGLCIGGSPSDFTIDQQELIPLDSAEGAEGIERIKLIYFIKTLQYFLAQRNTEKTIGEWSIYLKEVLENMVFESGEQEDEDYPVFVSFMDKLTTLDDAVIDMRISFEVFRHSLLQQLTLEAKSSTFSGAGITFCSLVPMRSVPFKVVGMLGLDLNKFPRKESPLSFSIMQKEKLKGDRNIKENDKHLFLETIMSAKEYLYISYIGKSSKDGSVIPPSSIVDELISYVGRAIEMDTETIASKWVTIHPLHGFSKLYFQKGGLINYLSEDSYKTKSSIGEQTVNAELIKYDEIKLQELISFFQNPPKYFLNKKLGIYYRDDEELIPEHEVFEFDKLMEWSIKNELIYTDENEVERVLKIKKLSGEIPLANMGKALISQLNVNLNELKSVYKSIINGKSSSYIDFIMDNSRIVGRVEEVFDNLYVYVCNSSDIAKHIIAAYCKYLAIRVQGSDTDMVFIRKNDTTIYTIKASTVSKEKAESDLKTLLDYFRTGLFDFFIFYPMFLISSKLPENHETLMAKYESAKEDDRNYDFTDVYLLKAIENGFFEESKFEVLQDNVSAILQMLPDTFTNLL